MIFYMKGKRFSIRKTCPQKKFLGGQSSQWSNVMAWYHKTVQKLWIIYQRLQENSKDCQNVSSFGKLYTPCSQFRLRTTYCKLKSKDDNSQISKIEFRKSTLVTTGWMNYWSMTSHQPRKAEVMHHFWLIERRDNPTLIRIKTIRILNILTISKFKFLQAPKFFSLQLELWMSKSGMTNLLLNNKLLTSVGYQECLATNQRQM
jgi:hypothetical protein